MPGSGEAWPTISANRARKPGPEKSDCGSFFPCAPRTGTRLPRTAKPRHLGALRAKRETAKSGRSDDRTHGNGKAADVTVAVDRGGQGATSSDQAGGTL